jgi:hypothetical protein
MDQLHIRRMELPLRNHRMVLVLVRSMLEQRHNKQLCGKDQPKRSTKN